MLPSLHLTSHHLCPYVQRAVIILTEKEIPHERTYIDLSNKPDWFIESSPLGRVPVLRAGEAVVFESQVIAEYLDEVTPGSLHPAEPLERARHRSWIEFGSETLNTIGAFYNANDSKTFEERCLALRSKFERIEQEIAGPFFSGSTFHMIDGVWGTIFRYFDVIDQIAEFGVMAGLEKTKVWRESVSSRPSVAQATPAGYPERLEQFLRDRKSYISSLMSGAA